MIILNRIGKNSSEILVNAELIETVEENPDTVVTLTTGKKLIVKENMEEIIQLVVNYKKSISI